MGIRPIVVSAVLALIAGLASFSVAEAQSLTTKSKSATKASPAGKKRTNSWAVNCGGGQAGGELVCRMVQNVIIQKTKQRLVSVIIQPAKKAENHQLIIAAPHGLNIPEGVELKVDAEKVIKFPIKTSDQGGTYASEPISDTLLDAMRRGRTLNVAYTFANGKKINIPLGLLGFTSAYNKLASN